MSTSFEKIFNRSTILQSYVVYINDIELLIEEVLSLEISFNYNNSFVEGNIVIKDSFGLADLDYFDGETTIRIYAVDLYAEPFDRTFRISSIIHEEYNDRFHSLRFNLIDQFYYKLANTYLSKSFNTDPVTAFDQYISQLSLDTYLTGNAIEKNFETSSSYNFVVPQDRSVNDFFEYIFTQNGLRFYQDRYSVNVKKIDFNTLEFIEVEVDGEVQHLKFSNNTDNNYYGFKIHDYKIFSNNIIEPNLNRPIQEHQTYDIDTKTINKTSVNLTDIYSTLQLSDKDLSSLQHTTGTKMVTDTNVYSGKQKLQVENSFNKNTTIEIVVPGNYKYNKVGMLVDVVLKGNPYMVNSALLGDKVHNGPYFVAKITDRYIGNKLLQKIVLHRVDLNIPRVNA